LPWLRADGLRGRPATPEEPSAGSKMLPVIRSGLDRHKIRVPPNGSRHDIERTPACPRSATRCPARNACFARCATLRVGDGDEPARLPRARTPPTRRPVHNARLAAELARDSFPPIVIPFLLAHDLRTASTFRNPARGLAELPICNCSDRDRRGSGSQRRGRSSMCPFGFRMLARARRKCGDEMAHWLRTCRYSR
jgi:hypothetical protein